MGDSHWDVFSLEDSRINECCCKLVEAPTSDTKRYGKLLNAAANK